jgi:hypothetical protein
MAILEGGIFSNPRGKTGGIVFGAARTRTGKKVTSRLLVPPSNPNTAAQQTQRGKFAESLAIVRLIGSSFYSSDFNRSIGQLPGFQSLTSVFLNAMSAISAIGIIPSINLGSLAKVDTFTLGTGDDPGDIKLTWSNELGLNGTAADRMVLLCCATDAAASPLERIVITNTEGVRSDADKNLPGWAAAQDVSCLAYFRGMGTAAGLISPTMFAQGTATA